MPRVTDQRQFFRTESLEYLRRNFEGKDLRRLPLVPILEDFLAHTPPMDLENGSILDLGCGPGNNLFQLFTRYGAQRGVGTEPSPEAVSILTEAYPELEFYESTTDTLPFSTGEFDLILLRSVLHWVDRNYLLQTIGEAIRVTARYLIISDFSPSLPYSTEYRHQPEYRTFKVDYGPLVEASGIMEPIHRLRHDDGDEWNAIDTVLFEKKPLDTAFPLRRPDDFTG